MTSLPHIFLSNHADTVFYTTPYGARGDFHLPERNREQHAQKLLHKLNVAWEKIEQNNEERLAVSLPSKSGMYLEFRSLAGHDLVTKSLENLPKKIRLLNIKKETGESDDEEVTVATVYLPSGQENFFINRISAYAQDNKNENLARSIEDIRLAVIDSFWQDDKALIPSEEKQWCEVWLRAVKGDEVNIEESFREVCLSLNVECKSGSIRFPERVVVLVNVKEADLAELIERSPYVAEFRLSKETASFWVELSNNEQAEWVQNLLDRTTINENTTSLCVLDTGVNYGHPLIAGSLYLSRLEIGVKP